MPLFSVFDFIAFLPFLQEKCGGYGCQSKAKCGKMRKSIFPAGEIIRVFRKSKGKGLISLLYFPKTA